MSDEELYLVPELNVKISLAWIKLVEYCQENLRFGTLKIEINNGQPGKKLKEIPSIRFDKPSAPKKTGNVYLVKSLDIRIPESWINMVIWCQNVFNSGTIEFDLTAAQPTELISAVQKVNFSKPETIPAGMPLVF